MTSVLVVEDEPKIAQLARDYLEHAGFRVVTVGDGRSALKAAARDHLDLIVLDLRLPDMDGLDVTRTLRKQSSVPIIMLTARVGESDELIGLELGVDDYMTKPFSLLMNSLQHTDTGGRVYVRCELQGHGDRPDAVVVSVADTGTGIAPEDLPHIFERFYKSTESRGSGLGLPIARHLIAMHGGSITAESEPGRGTTVRFTLPLTASP